jgi:hypothetical protein
MPMIWQSPQQFLAVPAIKFRVWLIHMQVVRGGAPWYLEFEAKYQALDVSFDSFRLVRWPIRLGKRG